MEMDKIEFSGVRGEEGLKEVEFDYNGRTIHAAVVGGPGNADALRRRSRRARYITTLLRLWHAGADVSWGGGQPVRQVREAG